jgi:hypothetical protein
VPDTLSRSDTIQDRSPNYRRIEYDTCVSSKDVARARDCGPPLCHTHVDPYVPLNSPAIGDLFDLFNFGRSEGGGGH